ncbi:hypothetical protein FBY35_0589 [Streptomyces sp. SLBN-118]|uniref:hypothetical protein n=1 Tax=Streptomyces sp. SLBN-118 TaxID=2768454 RepID=UPI001175653B|nr:hypothetical protein [Streptomyces sp. SLBN-118]TQK50265.1 hypothetical protein FBY35_0589 [Streptomyces sp. SLBN-118]
MPEHAAQDPPSRIFVVTQDLLHRAARVLGHRRPAGATTPLRPARSEQLRTLADVLDAAVAAQPLADRLVAACGEPEPVPGAVAIAAGEQVVVYHRLRGMVRALPADDDVAEVSERAVRLLSYHQWMLHQSLVFAFTTNPDSRVEAGRLQLNGLGAPADALRELRDQVRAAADGVPDGKSRS